MARDEFNHKFIDVVVGGSEFLGLLGGENHVLDPLDLRGRTLKAELLEAQGDLAQAYRQFDQALDPELVESCVYQISAVKARCNYLIRAIKERSPEAAVAAGLEGASTWT